MAGNVSENLSNQSEHTDSSQLVWVVGFELLDKAGISYRGEPVTEQYLADHPDFVETFINTTENVTGAPVVQTTRENYLAGLKEWNKNHPYRQVSIPQE